MHAYLALVLALAAPALAAAAAAASPDRSGYEREIDATRYDIVPKLLNYVLDDEYLASHKNNRAILETMPRPEEAVVSDNVVVESTIVKIIPPAAAKSEAEGAPSKGVELVRHRRGYNLENVRVPARYPYLPVANFNRFRRWG